ncbi:MAG: Uma2 family endonuclease [Pirellulaceae bacterium]
MSSPISTQDIEYPESDGRPMGESDVHRDWMVRIIELLKRRYRSQQVYVSGDLLVYYEQGNPKRFVVPDAFVVKNSNPERRRVYKLWEESGPPDVVFETTSLSTRRKDEIVKPRLYEQLGVKEYFLYDPTGEYLKPALQGYRLEDERRMQLEPDSSGALESRELGLKLPLERGALEMFDAETGERLQTDAEAERAAWETERAAREAERVAKEAEHAARLAAEAEVERLRKQLRDRDNIE